MGKKKSKVPTKEAIHGRAVDDMYSEDEGGISGSAMTSPGNTPNSMMNGGLSTPHSPGMSPGTLHRAKNLTTDLSSFVRDAEGEKWAAGADSSDSLQDPRRRKSTLGASAMASLQEAIMAARVGEEEKANRGTTIHEWMDPEDDDHQKLRGNLENFIDDDKTPQPMEGWLARRKGSIKTLLPPVKLSPEQEHRASLTVVQDESPTANYFDQWVGGDNGLLSPTGSEGPEFINSPLHAELDQPSPRSLAKQEEAIKAEKIAAALLAKKRAEEEAREAAALARKRQLEEAQARKLKDREEMIFDASSQEKGASTWATEDRDFVTPWYTYAIRFLMFPLGVLIFYFMYWRWYNYPRSGLWWSDMCAYTFILSEQICYLFAITHWVWMWNLKFRKRVTQDELNLTDEDLPTVDIMVPCYSEPTEIVEMTIKACYDMDYPAHKITIWVCDDGKKEAMKNMTETVGKQYKGKMKTRYIARTKIPGVPHHAKAGNLNNCILKEGSDGQLIIILDCDMMPEPCMARTVAPFFYKKLDLKDRNRLGVDDVEGGVVKAEFDFSTGLLQTPQAFYNLDTNDLLGQSYAFFYECFMSGWDGSGCTPCCGTGVTFSRYALTQVGGFSVGSITEDFKTSLNLCSHGFKCKYFLKRLTRGVSPKELDAFMVQRLRWAVGAIQIVLAGCPLFIKGLHPRARWLYFFSTVGIVYIIPVVIMGIIMYATILVGAPISFGPSSFEEYLVIGGSTVVLMMLMQKLAGWRLSSRDYLRALQDNFTVFWTLIQSILIGFCGMDMPFKVTNKDVSFDLMLNLRHAAPHFTVIFVSLIAIIKGFIEVFSQYGYGFYTIPWHTGYNVSLIYFSAIWTVFIWVMVSNPPRMVIYGYLRAKKEALSNIKCTNDNVPALQELPSTPMNTFPPLSIELLIAQEKQQEMESQELADKPIGKMFPKQ